MPDFNKGQAAEGALGGAAAGAAVGSVFPGIGTAVGAVGGGLAGGLLGGFFSGKPNHPVGLDQFDSRGNRLLGDRFGFGVGSRGGFGGAFRNHQLALLNQLSAQARGEGPSLAQAQFDNATQNLANNQLALAQSGQGSPGLANLTAAQNIGQGTQGLANQAATARLQEQLQAQQLLAGVAGQGRDQEIGASQFNVDVDKFNADLALRRNLGFSDLELRNAIAQNQALLEHSKQNPGLGTKLLSAGGSVLGSAFAGGVFS